jgi:ribosomal protein S18 acetylase RimI-like enzyme
MQRLVQFGRLNQTLHGTDGPLASIWGDISTLRHEVYSIELNQYEVELSGQFEDPGQYFIALLSGDSLLGYVSINAPERAEGFRLAKYYSEEGMNELLHLSTSVESKTFEIKALTIKDQFRGKGHAFTLMQAALHFSIAEGATDLIAMGHTSVLEMYKKLGMKVLEQHHVSAGEIIFHPMHLSIAQIEAQVGAQALACSGALTNGSHQ